MNIVITSLLVINDTHMYKCQLICRTWKLSLYSYSLFFVLDGQIRSNRHERRCEIPVAVGLAH